MVDEGANSREHWNHALGTSTNGLCRKRDKLKGNELVRSKAEEGREGLKNGRGRTCLPVTVDAGLNESIVEGNSQGDDFDVSWVMDVASDLSLLWAFKV